MTVALVNHKISFSNLARNYSIFVFISNHIFLQYALTI